MTGEMPWGSQPYRDDADIYLYRQKKKKKKKKHVCLLSSDCPFFFATNPKGFFIILWGIPGEFPVWPYYPYIKTFNKIKTFSDLHTLFNFYLSINLMI